MKEGRLKREGRRKQEIGEEKIKERQGEGERKGWEKVIQSKQA